MDTVVHLYLPAFCGFLGVCVFFALREPIHDPLNDYVDGFGDVPALPGDLKIRNHAERNTR